MAIICKLEGCLSKVHAKGMCKLHYQRQWKTGSPIVGRPCLHKPIEEKLWFYVNVGSIEECWEWTGHKDKDGYGRIRVGKTNRIATRMCWQLHHGEYPIERSVLHKCNNPSCVNPNHLYLGDHNQNMKDRLNAGNYPINEEHPNVKFSDEVVGEVRAMRGTYKDIGREHGMSESHVGNIKRGLQRSQKRLVKTN